MQTMRRGEVWWVDFDPARGGEIRKSRPAIIVSNDLSNAHLNRLQVVPVTSNAGKLYPCEAVVTVGGQTSKAMADQLTTVAKERLSSQLGTLSRPDLKAVEHILKIQLGLPL
jgi:mRNA interferase MazF